MNTFDTDVLIVGAGIAGLVTALNTRARRVCVLSPDEPGAASGAASDCAQGGIAAAVGPDDSPACHVKDTLAAACGESSVPIVRLVCRDAPAAVDYLHSLGVPFAREQGRWSLHQEAAHSRARADGRVMGVLAMSGDRHLVAVRARDVVIATGGIGALYSRSTNPSGACGDGLAMALAAGARCAGLEFVQFHPTALDVGTRPLPLLTEALRGAGACLIDDRGERIMRDVHPLADLAPRDVVARRICELQSIGRRVWLDATRLRGVGVREVFPAAYQTCRAHGMDLERDAVPVVPAAHYHMGGIAVDRDGRSSLPGLWAVGEAACTGLHGANRLASNSLLEAVVFGRRLGRALDRERSRRPAPLPVPDVATAGSSESEVERALREIMWRCMGVVRSAQGLSQGLTQLNRLREQTPSGAVLTRSRLMLAEHMMRAAAARRMNVGAHCCSSARICHGTRGARCSFWSR